MQKAVRFDANGLQVLYSLCQAVHVGLAYALQDAVNIAGRVCFSIAFGLERLFDAHFTAFPAPFQTQTRCFLRPKV